MKLGDTHSTKTCFTKLTTGQLGDDCTETVTVFGPHTPNTPTFDMVVELPGMSVKLVAVTLVEKRKFTEACEV